MHPPKSPSPSSISVALGLLNSGQPETAEARAQLALASLPDDVGWLTILALSLSMQLRPAEALPVYQKLVESQPDSATHWSNLGNCLCELERDREALPALIQALALGGSDAALHFALARAYSALGPVDLAQHHIERALEQAPDDAEFHLLRAKVLASEEQWEQAKLEIEVLLSLPMDAGQLADLGYLYLLGNMYDKAIAIFQSPSNDPGLAMDCQIGLVTALERVNRLDEALALRRGISDEAIALAPKLRHKFLRMDAKLAARRDDHHKACGLLRELIADESEHPTRNTANWFDLGVSLGKCDDPDGAMRAFANAHSGQRALVDPNHPSLSDGTGIFALLNEPMPALPGWKREAASDGLKDPVFVVGFPRSGTTLLEQLLDAHSRLASFDEQPFLQRVLLNLTDDGQSLQEALSTLSAEKIRGLRAGYFHEVRTVVPELANRRAVDKNPFNMMRLPLLQSVFPTASAVLAIRHPCDVVFSCYMQHFRSPVLAVSFNTLENTAQLYNRVFEHWQRSQAHLNWPVLVLRNEDLIADTEATARCLFEFLHLPWEAELLAFTDRAKAKGAIKTPSYTQVIEKVNAKGVGRWEAFREYFTPTAIEYLAPWVRYFGYAPID